MSKAKSESPKIYGYCRVSTAQQNLDRQESNIKNLYPNAVILKDEYTGTKMDRPAWSKLYKQELKQGSGDTIVFDSVSRMSRNADEGFTAYQNLYNNGVNLIFLNEPYINTDSYRKAMSGTIQTATTGDTAADELISSITKALNRFMMKKVKQDIRQAFEQAEKEATDTQHRVKEGIRERKLNNEKLKTLYPENYKEQPDYRQIGRTQGDKLNIKRAEPIKAIIRQLSRDFEGSNTDKDIMDILNGENRTVTISIKKKSGKVEKREVSSHISRNTYFKYKKELKEEMAAEV